MNTQDPNRLQDLLNSLSPEQASQQADLAMRMLHMASTGTPHVQSADPQAHHLLVLSGLMTAYLALARATPAVGRAAALMALDGACILSEPGAAPQATH